MRNITCINDNWQFSKDNNLYESVNIPHTWNNLDGQDGGADYLRQKCYYKKTLNLKKTDKKVFVEFQGVNHIANVTFNDIELGEHRGGFSTFRFEITDLIKDGENSLILTADNSENIPVYPQQADFTFFGGIYRDVNIIEVSQTHFDMMKLGSSAIFVTPTVLENGSADVQISSYVIGDTKDCIVKFEIKDFSQNTVKESMADANFRVAQTINIENPNLWNAKKNPYLYTLLASIEKNGQVLDNVQVQFGIRSFNIDNEKGFILNGKEYPLRGVSRHQDKEDKGWALDKADMEKDIELIKEVGANTIRLAHYQHSQYFYDLCDKEGFVLWAEIPFITMFIEGDDAKANTISQMKELVVQNYNHPSICFWGISNEITIGGESDALFENQQELVKVVNQYDKTRLTTLANVSFEDMDSRQNTLTDIVGYNHYFGWYGGELCQNEEWIDEFHQKYPNIPLGISEYGAEGILTLHTDTPKCRDYTEEYHAIYHEHMVKIFEERPFIWGTYQWNMFDFAADARDEGGVQGRNNKGLVSFDRKVKKDAFYLYKAYWNIEEKFIHITERRYFDRACEKTKIKIYSNEDEVTLKVNGVDVKTLKADKIFIFENIELNMGENIITAVSKNASDEIKLNRVLEPNLDYILVEEEEDNSSDGAKNWFLELQNQGVPTELTFNEEYFSIKDNIGEIMKREEAIKIFENMMAGSGAGFKPNAGMLKMVQGMKLEVVLKMAGKAFPEEIKYVINDKLQKIKK